MTCLATRRPARALGILCLCFYAMGDAVAQENRGAFGGTLRVVKFDKSPPLRDIPPILISPRSGSWGGSMIDPPGYSGPPRYGVQTPDKAMQSRAPSQSIPGPIVSFDALPNDLGLAPPDPVGDIGPSNYVAMSNLLFDIYDRSGNSVTPGGPAANNTLWSGFGGECEAQNAGDPIVLHDQFADRWLLSQFTRNQDESGNIYNCIAISETADPLGSYFRYQVSNGFRLFPDYPKYGVGAEAYFISTRDFTTTENDQLLSYVSVGAYALNRTEMLAGDPDPTIIYFTVDRSMPENVGDGLLPMDIDGTVPPPADSPHYFIGTMDDGGPYGAAQDALTVWAFDVDFDTPENSSFTLSSTVTTAAFDTIFPCIGSRGCIEQPGTANRIDHQGYRQRPLHRAAYRNFGTHEAIVTNQSVEADPGVSGIRWWEIRNLSSPVIHQEGTFAPGNTDGIQRWFGSIAQDVLGNMALGYSAANDETFPGVRYSGRLAGDPPGTMPQGEGVIVDGIGSQTNSQRWGDYSSMNVDPTDDCTFWYINEYLTSSAGRDWQLRVGAFKFDECGQPGIALSVASDATASICSGGEANYSFDIAPLFGFDMPVSLSAAGNPAPSTAVFSPNPVTPIPGSSGLTIGNTGTLVRDDLIIDITATAAGATDRMAQVELSVYDEVPGQPALTAPADTVTDVILNPTFEWMGEDTEEYTITLAADDKLKNIIWTETTSQTSIVLPFFLNSSTEYYWTVSPANACGTGSDAVIYTFSTQALPGDCPMGESTVVASQFDFESGAQGWTSGSNLGPDTWTLSAGNPASGTMHWHVDNLGEASDTFLTSPVLAIPSNLDDLTLRFFNDQAFEAAVAPNCNDGGMLEVSTNGGADFVEVVNGDLENDPYDGPLLDASNPLQGRDAWCASPQPYTDSRVDISSLAGENDVVFRFRVATDESTGGPGWDIDDVSITGCTAILDFEEGFENPDS